MRPYNGGFKYYTGGSTGDYPLNFAYDGGVYSPNDFYNANRTGLWRPPTGPVSGSTLYFDAGNYASYPGSGNTWYDLSGNDHNGTLTNLKFDPKNGGTLYFPGNGYCATPYDALVNLGANYTIFVMAKVLTKTGYNPFFSTYHDYNGNSIWGTAFLHANDSNYGMRSAQLRCYTGSGGWVNRFACSNTSTVDGSWKMYAVVGTNVTSNQNYTYYTNGNNAAGFYWWSIGGQSVNYWYANINDAKNSCFVGRQYSAPDPGYANAAANMELGVIMIYKSALNGTQIQQNYDYFKVRYGL